MKKRLLAILAVAGMMVVAAQSFAAVNTYSLFLLPTDPGDGGRFHVTIEKLDGGLNTPGSMFRVFVGMADVFPNNPTPTMHHGEIVQLSFWGNLGCAGGNTGVGSIAGISGMTVDTSFGQNPDLPTDSWVQTTPTLLGVKYAKFQSDNPAQVNGVGALNNVIKTGATNKFLQGLASGGQINLAGQAASARVQMYDLQGHLWEGCVDMSLSNVPEASSLALLLPGLLPLGLVMRRRARSKSGN